MRFLSMVVAAVGVLGFSLLAHANNDLSGYMDDIASAYKLAQKQAPNVGPNAATGDAAVADALTKARGSVLTSMGTLPDKVSAMTGMDLRVQSVEYQKQLAQLYTELANLEEAFLANDPVRVAAEMKTIDSIKETGHSQFRTQN